MIFRGTISEIRPARTGTGKKGEWANVEFEVTESNPQNESYPQIGLFDYFKNGEFAKFASGFDKQFKLGDEVDVEFNLSKSTYTKDKEEKSFYKTSAWKVTKVSGDNGGDKPPVDNTDDDDLDLPF